MFIVKVQNNSCISGFPFLFFIFGVIKGINDIYETLTQFLSMQLCKSDIIR